MIVDKNKGITHIKYNHLNLPIEIVFAGGNKIEYLYDAAGMKLQKKVIEEGKENVVTDYLDGYQYVDGVLEFYPHAEGYVNMKSGTPEYVYNYTDHLGNVRVSYTKGSDGAAKIVEEKNYYPFGLIHKGYNNQDNTLTDKYKYGYNGKEEQEELGLNWSDYGARNYDTSLGRWMNMDPATDLLESSTPYAYALNSPIIYLDEDGELPILINGKVASDDERADESYWTKEIVATITGSGIANPGGQIHYVDGDRYHYNGRIHKGGTIGGANQANLRTEAGYNSLTIFEFVNILSKLERDESGKVIEKIQIYTHSRGAAFGIGYTKRLLELIGQYSDQFADPNNVVDFVYNMAPHQSDSLTATEGVDSYTHDRVLDPLSGNDMKNTKTNFTTNEGGIKKAHSISTFTKDLNSFISSFSEGNTSQEVIDNFIKDMKEKYNINVKVKK
ncbi:hypothetical protein UJ101_01912 [Flavobacteriaceae bacterium UJ101]|nr:hypothetical protein UJ101_01912 [Flavobacteriaceae bacterium UJ101]